MSLSASRVTLPVGLPPTALLKPSGSARLTLRSENRRPFSLAKLSLISPSKGKPPMPGMPSRALKEKSGTSWRPAVRELLLPRTSRLRGPDWTGIERSPPSKLSVALEETIRPIAGKTTTEAPPRGVIVIPLTWIVLRA